MVALTARATGRLDGSVAVAAALVAAAATGPFSTTAVALVGAGVAFLAVGVARDSRRAITAGGVGLLGGALAAGAAGAPVLPVLVGVAATVVAWDLGGRGVDLRAQLGEATDTGRLEAVHVAASVGVAVAVAGVGWGVYRAGTGGQPVAALAFLLLAAALVASALS